VWQYQSSAQKTAIESSPLVVNGVIYVKNGTCGLNYNDKIEVTDRNGADGANRSN